MKKFIQGFFASIFSILFLMVLLVLSLIIFSKNILGEKSIEKYIKAVDIANIDLGTILGEEYNNKKLSDILNNNKEKYNINPEEAEKLLTSDVFTKKIAYITSNFLNYIIYAKDKTLVTDNDFREVLTDETVEKVFNTKMTKELKTEINSFITSTVNKINSLYDEVDNNKQLEKLKFYGQTIYSNKLLYILIGTLLVLYLFIALCRWSFLKSFMWIGIPSILVSLVYIIPFLLKTFIFTFLKSNYSGIDVIVNIYNEVFKNFLYEGLIFLGVGIILITMFIITRKKDYEDLKLDNL